VFSCKSSFSSSSFLKLKWSRFGSFVGAALLSFQGWRIAIPEGKFAMANNPYGNGLVEVLL